VLPGRTGALRQKCVPESEGTPRVRPRWDCTPAGPELSGQKTGRPLERLPPDQDHRRPQNAASHNSRTPQPTEEHETRGIVMTDPKNPVDGAAQPSVDDRTVPSPNPPGSDSLPPQPLPEGPGIGAAAWPSEQTTPVGRGEQTAGGTDPDHPHLFHLADWGGNVFPGGSLQGANSENWPILVGQKGAVYLARLAVGGIREPH
jgi:hypothetical protein